MAPSADLVAVSAVGTSTSFSESSQNLTLTANVNDATNSSTKVNEGTVTFKILQGSTLIGQATTSNTVTNGQASVSYALPASEAVGNYTINVSYQDTPANFTDNGTDTQATLAVSAASTTTAATSATTAFSASDQTVQLSASVTSPASAVNEGQVEFTILQGTTVIGTATPGEVRSGSANASYTLPGGTDAGSYTIEADYSDSSGNFAASSDASQKLTVTSATAAATTTAASNATATFGASSVNLTATVTSPSGTVNEGSVNFTLLQGTTIIGTATSGNVSNGSASASYALPAGTAAGTYTIEANYSDSSGAFAISSDTAHTLKMNAASATVKANDATATFGAQSVNLTATVTSSAGTVNEGTVTFKVTDSNGNQIGTAQGTVTGGTATGSLTLPGGTAAGSYTIAVSYSDSTGNFTDDGTDTKGKLTVSGAGTTVSASNTTASFSTSSQNVTLTATVTDDTQTVNEGSVTFTLVDSNGNTIGAATAGAVTNGSASVSYALPANTAVGSYTIDASYNDNSGNFDPSFDNAHTLTVSTANATKVGLTTITINPNYINGTAQLTLTAQVSNANGTVNEGVLSFTVAGVSSKANVVNGTASVQLTAPLQSVLGSFQVGLSYTDNAASPSFADGNATVSVSTNFWNAILPAFLAFDSSGKETMQFTVANQPLFGFAYSTSTGLLSDVNLSSISMPVTYAKTGDSVVAAVGNVPWGVFLYDTGGQYVGTARVILSGDGTPMWSIVDTNNQPVAELPYG